MEHVLPTGEMHLVFRLDGPQVRIFDPAARDLGHAVVGGARSSFYVKDISAPSSSVGVQLHPGAAALLFGASAQDLAGRHTRLDDLWGSEAGHTQEQLLQAKSPTQRLDVMEALLAARLPVARALHPAVAFALQRLMTGTEVGEVVKKTGYSHRHFVAMYREATGLAPKVHARVLRFQQALKLVHAGPGASWADVAVQAGFSDQSHFNREFRAFTGVAPEAYRKLQPEHANHLILGRAH